MGRLDGRRVLVTGASRGVGLAAACRLGQEGADVALLARPSRALDDAAERVGELGVRALPVPLDVADLAAVRREVPEAVAELGGLDVLVSNAAAVVYGPFVEVAPEDFERTVAVSFRGAAAVVEAGLPALRDSRGALVVVGSLMSRLPLPMFSSYAAAKHALRGWTNVRREELEAQGAGVGVSLVEPGELATPLWHQATSATGRLPRLPPVGLHPDVVAEAILECALDPRPELVVGGEARAIELLARTVPPVGALVLRAMYAWFASGTEPAPRPGALRASPPGVDRRSLMLARPSLLQAARRVISALPPGSRA